jgi:phenylpropionate dioxygenase-like ring-hydroxylating dioxygenase large terminal subunit
VAPRALTVAAGRWATHNQAVPHVNIGRSLPPIAGSHDPTDAQPDWVQANPRFIDRSLQRALARPGGGWYVVDASRAITDGPRPYVLDGHEYVAWRADGKAQVAPDVCPHMGAQLSCGQVQGGALVCPWHGLRLGPEGHGPWKPVPTHDDGVLVWAQLDGAESPTDGPVLPPRPDRFVAGVVRAEATCEPRDILANRLDPWHGVHFHPHSFTSLQVLDANEDVLWLRVGYKVAGPFCVEVDCTFHCPDRRTIVMTITDGDGAGSVVETHATPVGPGRTAMVEATLAASDRPGFRLARAAGRWIRPIIERRARRLWEDDLAYAERRYALRTREQAPGRHRPEGLAAHAPARE